jgi:hypothetical protein
MQGAAPDVGDLFWSTAEIPALAAEDPEQRAPTHGRVRMRQADDEEWTPLLLAAGEK